MAVEVNSEPIVVACVCWVDLHPAVDPLTGAVTTDARRGGFTDSDRAAVEIAIRAAEARGLHTVVLSVAPPESEGALAELAASGVDRAVRIDGDDTLSAAAVARALAGAIGELGRPSLVVCGDAGATWGSGAVPALVAHHLGIAQVLGVVELSDPGAEAPIEAVRRLDGGRREVVRVDGPAVLSVEGALARLRRAPLSSVMSWRRRGVEVRGRAEVRPGTLVPVAEGPIRPRARELAPPRGERALTRIVELTGALVERTPPRTVEAEPAEAAAAIVEQLRAWGYLGD